MQNISDFLNNYDLKRVEEHNDEVSENDDEWPQIFGSNDSSLNLKGLPISYPGLP